MKKIFILLVLASWLTGCHTRYDVWLNNGSRITGVTKPVLDKTTGVYRFKDAKGQEQSVKAMKVIQIAPHESKPSPYRPS